MTRRAPALPEDIVQMRVMRLIAHGVNPDDARDVAIEQIRVEMAQNLREREARGEIPRADKRSDQRESLAHRYPGVGFDAADAFEKTTQVPHKHGSTKSTRRKRPQKPVPPYKRFGE